MSIENTIIVQYNFIVLFGFWTDHFIWADFLDPEPRLSPSILNLDSNKLLFGSTLVMFWLPPNPFAAQS